MNANKLQKAAQSEAMAARSWAHMYNLAMFVVIGVFLMIVSVRLEYYDRYTNTSQAYVGTVIWPLYVDFIPLWILPIIIFLAASNFATTRVHPDSSLGKMVVRMTAGIFAGTLLVFAVNAYLKLEDKQSWTWVTVLMPIWALVLMLQLLMCFLIPGFIKARELLRFYLIYAGIWLLALFSLLVALKLDKEVPVTDWSWVTCFVPLWIVCLEHMVLEANVESVGVLFLLVTFILLPLRLDGVHNLDWAIIFSPPLLILVISMCVAFIHINQEHRGS